MKKKGLVITGKRLFLRRIVLSDASEEWVSWLNNKEVNQFLESRFEKHSLISLKKYILKINADPNTFFLKIIDSTTQKHIGNIKLGPINTYHKFGDIGIMIGNTNYWGKGYAVEAIKLLSDYAIKNMQMHKLTASAYKKNTGSIRAFLKAGFCTDGMKKRHFLFKGRYIDAVCLAKTREK